MRRLRWWWLAVAVGVVVAAVGLAFWLGLRPVGSGGATYIRIRDGSGWDTAVRTLADRGLIRSEFWSRVYLRVSGAGGAQLHPGTYRVSPAWDTPRIIREIRNAKVVSRRVTIPEGRTVKWIAELLEREQVCTKEEFLATAAEPLRYRYIMSFPLPTDTLEGYLFPDTYDMPPLLGAEGAVTMMLRNFERRAKEAGILKAGNLKDLVIVASMVEREAQVAEERPKIAGVIYNRLREGMRLQIDATVLYGLGEWKPRVPYDDLKRDTPYNTYLHHGLPPGPICNPGLASLMAAAHPDEHAYLYYVARGDGTHEFSETYAAHLDRKREIQSGRLGAN